MKIFNRKRIDAIFIYAFIFFNSISGLQIKGTSLNTVFVFGFVAFLCLKYLESGNSKLQINKNNYIIYYLICAALSCVFSLAFSYVLPHEKIVTSYLINIIVYLIIVILLSNIKDQSRFEIINNFRKGLIYAARIQAVWGIIQIVLQYGAGININTILFVDILKTSNTRDWVMGFYTNGTWNMRITGLNFENSMFAMCVCIGMALENNKLWKILLMFVGILSLSRTGWIMIAAYILIELYRFILKKGKIRKKHLLRNSLIAALGIVFLVFSYKYIPSISRQISNIFFRLNDSSAINASGSRHLLYYPYGFLIWLTRSNPLQMLLGYGMRCSGVAFSENPDIAAIVGVNESFSQAWVVECDVIGLLLGGGILTTYFYYKSIFSKLNTSFLNALIVIFIGGLSYHFHSISYVLLVIIVASFDKKQEKYLVQK